MFYAPPADVLRRHQIDTVTVIFDRRSGATFFLDIMASAILDKLIEQPMDREALRAAVAEDHAMAASEIPLERIDQSCRELKSNGLIEKRVV